MRPRRMEQTASVAYSELVRLEVEALLGTA